MLDIWFQIPVVFRALFACAVLAFGTFTIFNGYSVYEKVQEKQTRTHQHELYADNGAKNDFEIGFVTTILGIGLLAISGRSRSEKNGYRSC